MTVEEADEDEEEGEEGEVGGAWLAAKGGVGEGDEERGDRWKDNEGVKVGMAEEIGVGKDGEIKDECVGIVFNVVVLPFRFRNSQSKAASTFRFNVTVFEATVAFLRQCQIQPQPPNHVQNSSLKFKLFIFIQTRLI